jgi:hypothetical protein
MSAEHKHHRFCGTVIGSYDGVYGVLLDTGEYMDIPVGQAQVIMVKENIIKAGGMKNETD